MGFMAFDSVGGGSSASTYSTSPITAARQFLSEYWDGTLPVNPFLLARRAGLVVATADVNAGYSGRYMRAHRTIEINANESEVRQRFTCAHEIGHHVLNHEHAHRDSLEAFSSRNFDPKERAANQFAAELLMPTDPLTRLVRSGQIVSVDELARMFKVSQVAMTYRMNNLGIAR